MFKLHVFEYFAKKETPWKRFKINFEEREEGGRKEVLITFPCGAFFCLLIALLEKAESFGHSWDRGQRFIWCVGQRMVQLGELPFVLALPYQSSSFSMMTALAAKHRLGGQHFFECCCKLKERKQKKQRHGLDLSNPPLLSSPHITSIENSTPGYLKMNNIFQWSTRKMDMCWTRYKFQSRFLQKMFITVPVYFPLPSVDLSPGIQRDFWVSDSNKAIGICNSSRGKHWTQVLCFLVKGCTLDCRLVASYHSWSVGDLLIHQLCLRAWIWLLFK